jgi:hypothetical protein
VANPPAPLALLDITIRQQEEAHAVSAQPEPTAHLVRPPAPTAQLELSTPTITDTTPVGTAQLERTTHGPEALL